jgi:hypothetical protein
MLLKHRGRKHTIAPSLRSQGRYALKRVVDSYYDECGHMATISPSCHSGSAAIISIIC